MDTRKRLIDLKRGEFLSADRIHGKQLDWQYSIFCCEPHLDSHPVEDSDNISINFTEGRFAFYLGVRETLYSFINDINLADEIARKAMANEDTFKGFVWSLGSKGYLDILNPSRLDKKYLSYAFIKSYRENIGKYSPILSERFENGMKLADKINLQSL